MCSSDFSLKLIAAACLLIIVTDTFVLQQIVEKQDLIHMTSDPEVYQTCYKPQIRMRIIFTAYAINSASVCFVLTLALMCCDEFSEWFDKIVNGIAEYMYFAFGPVLFTFCLFGVTAIPQLAYECTPFAVTSRINLMDVTILLICLGLSFSIVFLYGLQWTNRLAEKDLGDEHSVFYQYFSTYMKRQRQKYHQEKKRRQQMRGLPAGGNAGSDDPINCGSHAFDEDDEMAAAATILDQEVSATAEHMPLKFNREISGDTAQKDFYSGSSGEVHNRSYTNMTVPPLDDGETNCTGRDAANMSFTDGQKTYTGL